MNSQRGRPSTARTTSRPTGPGPWHVAGAQLPDGGLAILVDGHLRYLDAEFQARPDGAFPEPNSRLHGTAVDGAGRLGVAGAERLMGDGAWHDLTAAVPTAPLDERVGTTLGVVLLGRGEVRRVEVQPAG